MLEVRLLATQDVNVWLSARKTEMEINKETPLLYIVKIWFVY